MKELANVVSRLITGRQCVHLGRVGPSVCRAATASPIVIWSLLLVSPASGQVEVAEATIGELQEAMESGLATSAQITEAYLARIEAYDQAGPRLNAMVRLNADAVAQAEALDRERATSGARGPLHGIPIILKDNYDTFDMPTSAGSLTLAGLLAPDDAFQVRRLRDAGAVILGKANMHEFARGITTIASLGGQTLNPYDPARNPGGSSGGTGAAVAASYAAVGWGSDTCGSIRIPSSHNNLVGLRPTKGLSSIDGIIPLSHTQDVGGPLARTIEDLAIALDATVGADPADSATSALSGRTLPRFVEALDAQALDAARIGILHRFFGDGAGEEAVSTAVRDAIGRMVELGADTVAVEFPEYDELEEGSSLIGHEFKWDLLEYLSGVPGAPLRTLDAILDVGLVHERLVGSMRRSESQDERDEEAYREAFQKRESLRDAVVSLMNERSLDALVYPTIRTPPAVIGESQGGSNCRLSAATGLPALSVPAGWARHLPVGIELLARPFEDARLLAFGYALERASPQRRPPRTAPSLIDGAAPLPSIAGARAVGPTGSSPAADARFEYDPLLGTLAYQIEVTGVPNADDIYAVVLRHADEEGAWYVAERLSGPGVGSSVGTVRLPGEMLDRLEAGELYLGLVTRGNPVNVAAAQIVLRRR